MVVCVLRSVYEYSCCVIRWKCNVPQCTAAPSGPAAFNFKLQAP
jgi:hypothetical protein